MIGSAGPGASVGIAAALSPSVDVCVTLRLLASQYFSSATGLCTSGVVVPYPLPLPLLALQRCVAGVLADRPGVFSELLQAVVDVAVGSTVTVHCGGAASGTPTLVEPLVRCRVTVLDGAPSMCALV